MCKIDKVLILRISLFLYPLIFLISCNVKKTKEALDTDHNPIVLETKEYVVPPSDILNLKSYYLSAVYQKDSAALLYGYNYKSHALDVFDLSTLQTGQLSFFKEGPSGVQRPIYGFFVCSPDSVWVFDASLSFLLINKSGEVLKRIQSQQLLKSDETAQGKTKNHGYGGSGYDHAQCQRLTIGRDYAYRYWGYDGPEDGVSTGNSDTREHQHGVICGNGGKQLEEDEDA